MKRVSIVVSIVLTVLAAACWAAVAPAGAAPRTIAATGEAAGQVNSPVGVAVDRSSGALFVADEGNNRIDKFDAAGQFRLGWGFSVADGTSLDLQTCGPEATPPTDECFVTTGEGRGSEAPGAVAPARVAVDQANGDVYVASFSRFAVQKFGPDGEFLLVFGDEVDKTTGADVCTAADLAGGDECGGGVRGSGPGQIESRVPPLAVDGSGHVWIGDEGRLEEFSEGGVFLSEVALPGAEFTFELGSLAVDAAGDFYVIDSATAGVRKLTSAGVEIETLDATGSAFRTLALDGGGNLFVADRQAAESPAVFREFDPTGAQIAQFGAGEVFGITGPFGIAVDDATGTLYSTSTNFGAAGQEYAVQAFPLPEPGPLISGEHASAVLPTSATLGATLDPEGHETTYHFEYGTSSSYGQTTPAGTLPAGFVDESVEAGLVGLAPATTYHFRLVAEDDEGHVTEGADQVFTTLPAVQIENESAVEVSASAATFAADLNPLGAPAEWWVEYGIGESYGAVTAKAQLAAGFSPVPVSVHVPGLVPGATYHYRFVADDEREGHPFLVHGADQTFTTQPAPLSASLLDGRTWEMVTPVAKPGFVPPLGHLGDLEAAADGSAFTYLTAPLSEAAPGSRASDQVLARRDPSQGWRSVDLALPEEEIAGPNAGNLYPYRMFSPDLSEAIVEPPSGAFGEALDQPLSPEASERTPYLRRQAACEASPSNCYMPVATGKPGFANVPPGTEFGGAVQFVGASADLRHVVVSSSVPLSGDPAPEGGLYEWSPAARALALVSVLPGGAAAPGAALGFHDEETRQAVSAGGARVAFTSERHLYLRDTSLGKTVQLDLLQGGSGVGLANPVFQAASADGSRVFFTDEQRLTADSGAGLDKPDLFVCEIAVSQPGGNLECRLTDLTPRSASGQSAALRGIVAGVADDGSDVYFVANGALSEGAVAGSCSESSGERSAAERCNLYVVRDVGGQWQQPRLIAVLTMEDAPDWAGASVGSHRLSGLTSRVSPSGRWLAFMSDQSLAGYDTRDAASGQRDEEVYLYDAAAANGEGLLRCASCNPSGARPRGAEIVPPSEAVDAQHLWSDRWLAANVPAWTNASGLNTLHQPRYLSDSGRLFFNSADALAPSDVNGNWDVYEFEPNGVGGCDGSRPEFSARVGGCVGLISSGSSGRQSAFIDAGESGDDVFFWTHAQLVPQDADSAADIYDAHVCGAGSPCPPPPASAVPCEESSSCRGALAGPPVAPVAGTEGFFGPGNQRSHHHHKRKHRHRHRRHKRHPQTAGTRKGRGR